MSKQGESVETVRESAAPRPRGKWTAEQRRRAVADSRLAGASVQEVARRHGVRADTWPRRCSDVAGSLGGGAMMGMPPGARIWLACGVTDLRRGFDGLAALVQTQLAADPYAGHLFVFRGRRGNRLKILWYSGDGLNLLCKRLDGGRFVWPQTATGTLALTSAELSMLPEGIDWRRARRTTLAPIDAERIVPTRAA
jgi:transposase